MKLCEELDLGLLALSSPVREGPWLNSRGISSTFQAL